jgi:hypothetical protein
MDMGLYTDTRCIVEYKGSVSVEKVLGNIIMEAGSGDHSGDNNNNNDDTNDDTTYLYNSYAESLAAWDSAFEIFKICQPCLAYDLRNVGWNNDDDANRGSNYESYTNHSTGTYNWDDFDCYDDAGYTNVNQVCGCLFCLLFVLSLCRPTILVSPSTLTSLYTHPYSA